MTRVALWIAVRIVALAMAWACDVHDARRPDCHATEVELRGADWWARLGTRRDDGDIPHRGTVRISTPKA